MNPRMLEYFRLKLLRWREELLDEATETLQALQDGGFTEADIADRASAETNRALELRTRDRARKLIAKIDEALVRIENAHLRLLRGDARADQHLAAGRPSDRHAQPGSAGAPRADGEDPPRRVSERTRRRH